MATTLFGVAGWSYPDWAGIVHPARLRGGPALLAHVGAYVDVVEINVTFYRPVDAATTARWAAVAVGPADLSFVAKLHQDHTHGPREAVVPAALAPFAASLQPLVRAGRLHAVLAQLPVTARATPAEQRRVRAVVEGLAPLPVALEVRHRSWLAPRVLADLGALGVSLVHPDMPWASDHLPEEAPVLGGLGYLRLHGRNRAAWFRRGAGRDERYDHLYGPREVEDLLARVRRLEGASDRVLVIGNNHPRGQALATVLEMKARHQGGPVPAPASLVEHFPHLGPWVAPAGQLGLFS